MSHDPAVTTANSETYGTGRHKQSTCIQARTHENAETVSAQAKGLGRAVPRRGAGGVAEAAAASAPRGGVAIGSVAQTTRVSAAATTATSYWARAAE